MDNRRRADFYPRPPRGGRPNKEVEDIELVIISIHALREEGDKSATKFFYESSFISIHALREEGDSNKAEGIFQYVGFLSTPSARRATVQELHDAFRVDQFLSTPSARRATIYHGRQSPAYPISIHALREEGDMIS